VKKTYQGSCHCGAVRFEADIDLAKGTFRCNCSICFKTRAWLAGGAAGELRLLAGESDLGEYQFGRKVLHHRFCRNCGMQVYAHSKDQFAVRVTCLDGVDPKELIAAPVQYFDMRHDDMKTPPAETRHL
jgi:hypothetical protein